MAAKKKIVEIKTNYMTEAQEYEVPADFDEQEVYDILQRKKLDETGIPVQGFVIPGAGYYSAYEVQRFTVK